MIASTMGLDANQYAPKESPASGSFDTDTSQLQEVTRKRDESGGWQYESLLVDAEGRTMAEGIYRGVVMPLLQQIVKAQKLAEKAASEAARMQALERTSETKPIGTEQSVE